MHGAVPCSLKAVKCPEKLQTALRIISLLIFVLYLYKVGCKVGYNNDNDIEK